MPFAQAHSTTAEASHTTAFLPDEASNANLQRDDHLLGPDSLLWAHFGDWRGLLLIFRTGLLQNMHPAVSRALEQHSGEVFLKNPWNRLLRSLPPIMGVIYGPDPDAIGHRVRDFHTNIKGNLPSGQAYHALNPDVFYWTHATFFEGTIAMCERFGKPLSEAEQEQMYRESVAWYARYGLSMRPVPPDYTSFKRYWAEMLAGLKPTPITDHALKLRRTPRPFESIPQPIWWLVDPMINRMSLWLARGTLPPPVRAALGWQWSANDERLLQAFAMCVRGLFAVLPREWRYLPMVRKWRAQDQAKRGLKQMA